MRIQTPKASFAVRYLDLEEASGVPGAKWEPFQIVFLDNTSRYGADVKARQIAWSFTAALDAVVDGILAPGTPHIFVSINQDEAREKIRYGRQIWSAIRPDRRPALVRDSQLELEFANGSRLISHPCRPPRGKARTRIYLDEMAHYPEGLDREIYRAALPATTKGDGYIRLGSSPLGARGLFWEIVTEGLRRYPGFDEARRFIPWWHVRALCNDVATAARVAPEMLTEERVRRFGTVPLVDIFENMFLEDFQQEYECAWVDEASSWIPWSLIQDNQNRHDGRYWRAKNVDDALGLIPQVQEAIRRHEIEDVLVGGVDIGRKRDLTELIVLGKATTGQLPVRVMVSLAMTPFDDQERCLREIIARLPFTSVLVDETGIGAQLAENLHRRTGKAQGVTFTNPNKELWAVETRLQMERGNVPLPPERDLAYQIHSIKKKVTASKNNVFDTEGNERHHADQFWALALALQAGDRPTGVLVTTGAKLYGSRQRANNWGNDRGGRRGSRR